MSSCNIIPPLRKAGVTVGDKGCTMQQKLVLRGLMLAFAKTPKHQIRRSHMHGWRRDPSMPPPTPPKKLFDFFPLLCGCKRLCPVCDVADDFSQYELITGDRRRETDGGPAFELWHQRTFFKHLKIAADLQVCVFQSRDFGASFLLAFFSDCSRNLES